MKCGIFRGMSRAGARLFLLAAAAWLSAACSESVTVKFETMQDKQ